MSKSSKVKLKASITHTNIVDLNDLSSKDKHKLSEDFTHELLKHKDEITDITEKIKKG